VSKAAEVACSLDFTRVSELGRNAWPVLIIGRSLVRVQAGPLRLIVRSLLVALRRVHLRGERARDHVASLARSRPAGAVRTGSGSGMLASRDSPCRPTGVAARP